MADGMSKQVLALSELIPYECGVSVDVFVAVVNAARKQLGISRHQKLSTPEMEAIRRACSVLESVLLSKVEVVE